MDNDTPRQRTIRVGNVSIGLVGFDTALNEVLQKKEISNQEALHILFESIQKQNYVPAGTEESYKEALLKEYQRAKGEKRRISGELTIRVLGRPCVSCSRLGTMAIDVLQKLNIAADVENVHELDEIWRYGLINTPALIINDEVKCAGRLPAESEVEEWIKDAISG